MKSYLRAGLAAALTCGLTAIAWGQPAVPAVPAAPAVPGVPAAPLAAPAGVPTAAPANNIWSFFGRTPEQKAACKEAYCKSSLSLILGSAMAPAKAMTGGLMGGCCPPALPSDLAKPADSAEGAAARIKEDEANAKKRRADVRYLGTVDCRYWPEAKEALINALRADKNECVRFEAALALGNGCCCNKATIRALTISVSCSDEDGNPPEPSERVREAAMKALHHCLDSFCDFSTPKPPKPGEPGGAPAELPPAVEEKPKSDPIKDPKKDGGLDPEKGKDKEGPKPRELDPKKDGEKKDGEKKDTASAPRTSREYYQRVSAAGWDRIIADGKTAVAKYRERRGLPTTEVVGQSLTEVIGRSTMPRGTVIHTAPPPVAPTMTVTTVAPPAPVRVMMPPATAGKAPALIGTWSRNPVPAAAPVVVPVTPTPIAVPVQTTPNPAASPTYVPLTPPTGPRTEAPTVRPAVAVGTTPATGSVVKVSASVPAESAVVRSAYSPAETTRHTVTVQPKERLLVFFHRSAEFQHREWAANQMSLLNDGATDEQVVTALVKGAEADSAATVRVACLTSLRTLGVKTARVVTVVEKLLNDPDLRVRATAAEVQRWVVQR